MSEKRVIRALAPTGRLRVAINFGNAVLVQKESESGRPVGIAVDIAHALADQLGVSLVFVPFVSAGRVVDVAQDDVWDLAFLARDVLRADVIDFTAPYVLIEGSYLVRSDSIYLSNDELDRPGIQVAVGKSAAYDLFLSRTLTSAELVRAPTTPGAVELFIEQKLDAAAGVRLPLLRFAADHPEYRVLDGHFMVIEQALAVAKGNVGALGYLSDFIERLKANGFIAAALNKSGQHEAIVAPPLAG